MAKKTDPQVEAANEIYKTAREQADNELAQLKGEIEAIREESQALGILRKIEYDVSHNQMLKFVVLHRIKQAKDYRKGGMTWAQFCEAIGESVRSIDNVLADLQPLAEGFSAKFADFAGLHFNKIRYLGRTISAKSADFEDGMLVIDDQRIALTPENKDEIEALIDVLKENATQQIAEAEASLLSKDRVLQDKEDLINKKEKQISQLEAKLNGLSPEEDKFLKQLDAHRLTMDGFLRMFEYDPADGIRDDLTPRMKAALLETLGYFRKVTVATHEAAKDLLETLEEPWDPDAEIAAFEAEQKTNLRSV